MIGVVGPHDAVGTLLGTAVSSGHDELLMCRRYDSLKEAPQIAKDLDEACNVILFTGKIPFMVSKNSAVFRAKLQYVASGTVDLYRTLSLILLKRPSAFHKLSIDTVNRDIIAEVFRGLRQPIPSGILPLENISEEWPVIKRSMVDFHKAQYEAGLADVCVSCVGQVFDELTQLGIPSYRVEHTVETYRNSLVRAELADAVMRSTDAQFAVGVIRCDDCERRSSQDGKCINGDWLRQVAVRLKGHAVRGNGAGEFVVYSNRGTLESEITRIQAGYADSFITDELRGVSIGFGVGPSTREAVNLAERAVDSVGPNRRTSVIFHDGTVICVDGSGRSGPRRLRINVLDDNTGSSVGGQSMKRLIQAIPYLECSSFTVQQLATALAVHERHARRVLNSLVEKNVAAKIGARATHGAGRPRSVYSLDLGQLLSDSVSSVPSRSD